MTTRWGILGTGRIANVFCDTLLKVEDAEIYAVGSRTEEKAKLLGAKYHAKKCYSSYEELVSDPDIDIVYVATPIICHYEHVKVCLLAGKNVLCEKLFVQTTEEAEELIALAKSRNLFLMEALWTKFHPVYQKIVQWKEEGKFGDVKCVEASFYTCGTKEHRLYKDTTQGGCLGDLLIYPLLYACTMLGYKPIKVNAAAMKNSDNIDIVESIQMQYTDGKFAALTGGIASERQALLSIYGTEGRMVIHKEYFYEAQSVTLLNWNNEIIDTFECPFEINGYEYEVKEVMQCLRAGQIQSMIHPMEDVIGMLRLMETCRTQWDESL
ncbi:MAG: Gfo/Idh/MocA family oxidoreductase [Eubacterium sp.]|nr:Gfo/Idh/MocA family oxidoreductase [Eubacterium sp.]